QQQWRPRVVVEVDRGGRVRVEIGEAGLEQDVVRAGDRVAIVNGPRLLLTQEVAKRVVKLCFRWLHRLVKIGRVLQCRPAVPDFREGKDQNSLHRRRIDRDAGGAQSTIEQDLG